MPITQFIRWLLHEIWYIYRQAKNDVNARAIEKHYLGQIMKGVECCGYITSFYVYCNEIKSETVE